MSLPKKRTSPDDGSGPAPKTPWLMRRCCIQSRASILPGYVVLMITKYDMPRRQVYLDLGAARTAVAKAHANGQPARLVLCTLTPVAADLGEVTE